MKSLSGILLFPLALILGCALPSTTSSTPSGSWQNWQIQAGAAITSPPNTYPSFLGAIQAQGTQAAGVFTPVNTTGNGTTLDFDGTFNASTQTFSLASFGYGFGYTPPAVPYTLTPVSVIGGCIYPLTYTGPECLAIFSVPSTGVRIADVSGTYTGSLLNPASPNLSNASLNVVQSTAPNPSGQFPLTATLIFMGDLSSYSLTGTVSGEGITLMYFSPTQNAPSITLAAATNPASTQLTISSLTLAQTGQSSTYTGTLTRQ
jgi:hypothetical protein